MSPLSLIGDDITRYLTETKKNFYVVLISQALCSATYSVELVIEQMFFWKISLRLFYILLAGLHWTLTDTEKYFTNFQHFTNKYKIKKSLFWWKIKNVHCILTETVSGASSCSEIITFGWTKWKCQTTTLNYEIFLYIYVVYISELKIFG